ncbi:hypothetical protein L6164_023172 [Bauhinia variegata]|uniref:Uncharacterized protein n=1 Tax=Bauhinia variegata TaxID=167791 RepID=A0ACB9MHF3_BAUVA|nr:hypothetical protein L6164_023172 [Bauhinia variegata]
MMIHVVFPARPQGGFPKESKIERERDIEGNDRVLSSASKPLFVRFDPRIRRRFLGACTGSATECELRKRSEAYLLA